MNEPDDNTEPGGPTPLRSAPIGLHLITPTRKFRVVADVNSPIRHGLAGRRGALRVGLAVTLLYVVALVFLAPQFATNDDTAMWGIVSGTIYGSPSDSTVFMNTLVGLGLRVLYTLTDQVPWYAIVFYTAQIIAVSLMAFAAARVAPTRRRTVLVLTAILVGFTAPLAVHYQFTSTSILLAGAGTVMYFSATIAPKRGELLTWRWFVAAGLLFGAGYLVRSNGAVSVAVVTFPFALLALWRHRTEWRRAAITAGVALAVIITGATAGAIRYSDDAAWEAFNDFNEPRSQLHSTPRLQPDEELAGLLGDVGWTWADRAMFDNWFYTNPAVFETADLEYLLEERSYITEDLTFGEALTDVLERYAFNWALLASIAALLAIQASRRSRLTLAASLVWFAAVGVYLTMFLRFPERVADPLFVVLAFAALVTAGNRADSLVMAGRPRIQWRFWLSIGLTLAVAVAAAFSAVDLVAGRNDRTRLASLRQNEFEQVRETIGPEGIVVNWGGFLSYERTHPFAIERHPANDLDVVGLGWRARTPEFDQQLVDLEMENVELAIADRGDVYVVTSAKLAAVYATYLFDHYGRTGVLWPVETIRNGSGQIYQAMVDSVEYDGRLELHAPWGPLAAYEGLGTPALGGIELVAGSPTALGSVSGWARHPSTGDSADGFLVIIDGEAGGYSTERAWRPSPDDDGTFVDTGFFVAVPANRLASATSVRVIALFEQTWAEVLPVGSP